MATNIVGLDLNIDKDYLAQAVQQTVLMGISEALNGKNEIVSQIVKSVLCTKVNKEGKVDSYRNDYTLLEYYVREMLKGAVLEEIKNLINEKRPEVSAMIRKELSKKVMIEQFADNFIKATADALDSNWRTNIDVQFKKRSDD